MKHIAPITLFCLLASACGGTSDAGRQSAAVPAAEVPQEQLSVPAEYSSSGTTTVSKGTIESVVDVEVYCQLQEQVVQLYVNEGQKVRKGQVLIMLNEENLMAQLIQARNEFEQAESSYQEILVGQGYTLEHLDQIPEYTVKMAKVKSSYNIREESLRQAERNYEKRKVLSPISGIVSEIKVHQYDLPQTVTPVCRVFDGDHMKVVFNVLESEMEKVRVGHIIKVTTIAHPNDSHNATINIIASKVDQRGMVRVEAELEDSKDLMPGMTAMIEI